MLAVCVCEVVRDTYEYIVIYCVRTRELFPSRLKLTGPYRTLGAKDTLTKKRKV